MIDIKVERNSIPAFICGVMKENFYVNPKTSVNVDTTTSVEVSSTGEKVNLIVIQCIGDLIKLKQYDEVKKDLKRQLMQRDFAIKRTDVLVLGYWRKPRPTPGYILIKNFNEINDAWAFAE